MEDTNRVDIKAYIVELIYRIPYILWISAIGAVVGSGLYLTIILISTRTTEYEIQTRFYIDFTDMEAKNSYNAFTWNTVLGVDEIMDNIMNVIGDKYDRDLVKNMMNAEILSDVRYLLVTITGDNPEDIAIMKKALVDSLEKYGQTKKEFNRIYVIEEGKIAEKKVNLFAWRAAILGATIFLLIELFTETIRFGIGSRFYSRSDIKDKLKLNALGIEYKCSTHVMSGSIEKKKQQDEKIIYHLEYLGYSLDDILFITFDYDFVTKGYNEFRNYKGIVIEIPARVDCREKVTDILLDFRIQNINVVGAILVNVDVRWYNMYMFGLK